MSHTITQSDYKTTTPTGLYEANYRRLIRLLPHLNDMKVNDNDTLSKSDIFITILEQHKYTTVISLQQSLQFGKINKESHEVYTMTQLNSIDMELRICHDARLAEVIGYQGKSPIQSANIYPNKHMLQIDEKRQLNLFLKDVLEISLKTEYHH